MTALIQANSIAIPLADESVSLIVTSPPYFALRSYRDGGEHYDGQVGSESTPQAFLEALWLVMHECWRVLRPDGSCFVNLGDKRSGAGGHNNGAYGVSGLHKNREKSPTRDAGREHKATLRNAPDRYNQSANVGRQMVPGRTKGYKGIRAKSKMLLPHRFAIGCEDGMADPEGIGWIVRSDMVWNKPNGLPESVTDRVRDSHEFWFHLVKQGRYFSAVDEIREPHAESSANRAQYGESERRPVITGGFNDDNRWNTKDVVLNPLGRLPGSVWTVASEPLTIPEAVKAHYDLPDHFAAFPTELVRRIVLGWSPSGVCTVCDEGRRPVVEKGGDPNTKMEAKYHRRASAVDGGDPTLMNVTATITGYACACTPDDLEGWEHPPTREAIILDPFSGTGTTVGVANTLGRFGVGIDLSWDYLRLSRWRVEQSGHFAKVMDRTNAERQGSLF